MTYSSGRNSIEVPKSLQYELLTAATAVEKQESEGGLYIVVGYSYPENYAGNKSEKPSELIPCCDPL